MEKNQKLGLGMLGLLLVGTFGAHAAYARHNAERAAETELRPARGIAALPRAGWTRPAPPNVTEPVGAPLEKPSGAGAVRVEARLDRTAVLRQGDGTVHVQLTVDTHGLEGSRRVPTDFLVVFDRSGSMRGQKMDYGKQALRQLIERLDDDDRFALIAYDSNVEVRVPLERRAKEMRNSWMQEVNRLDTAGGTNISAGLDSGVAELSHSRRAGRAQRVLLLSDGLANEGATSPAELSLRAQRIVAEDAVLTTVGVGADFDERVMTSLAKGGSGAFYYLAKLEALSPLLDAELKTASETYAQGAEIALTLPPSVRLLSATGGVSTRRGESLVVPVGSLYSDHTRTFWLTLAVPTDGLKDNALGSIALRYRRDGKLLETRANELPKVACVADEAEFKRQVVEEVWEHAMLDEELGSGQQALGEAIRSGTAADVDQVVATANRERQLAEEFHNQKVLGRMQALAALAPSAKAAQASSAEVRSLAAKKATADGFESQNQGSYRHFAPSAAH